MRTRKRSITLWPKISMAFVVFSVILCLGIAGSFGGGTVDELFVKADSVLGAYVSQSEEDPTVVWSRPVRVNFDALDAEAVILNLFDAAIFIAVKDRVERRTASRYTWFGRVEGFEGSQVILVVDDGDMAGNITIPGELYQVRPLGNGVHVVREIDQSAFPDEAPPTPVEIPPDTPDVAPSTGAADDGSIIDVMVVYTPAAAAASANIQSEIQLAIDETNQSYANSGITQRVALVHTAQVTYTEPAGGCSIYDYRNRLQNPSDGYMDNVHSLRDSYKADLVLLIVENGCGYCGVAYIMTSVSTAFENYGFAVAARGCATGYYSFGHELGHVMSARHDWYVDSTNNSPYTYNHAYVAPAKNWRTIMAYGNDCGGCTRLQYWSNPDVLYGGVPMGVPEGSYHAADNRKTLNNTAYTVANFRVSSAAGGPFPVLFNDGGRLFIEAASLGTLGPSQWALIVVFPDYQAPNPADMAIGFYFWEPSEQDITITITDMGLFTGHSYFANWASGTPGEAFGASVNGTWTNVFSTSPISTSADGGGMDLD